MKRRIVCAWLPSLAAERLLKTAPDRDWPFAATAEARGALRLCSLNRAALAAGLAPGMALADARAMLPDLATAPRDAGRDAGFLRALGRWAQRFTPSVAVEDGAEGDGSLMLNTAGCAHLFGGEEAMLAEIEAGLARFGLTARLGLADTRGCAAALAKYGETRIAAPGEARTALSPLPVAALGFDAEACAQLQRLGLRNAGDVARLPRAALAKRFGVEAVRRVDRALGIEAEPMAPMAQERPHAVRLSLPEPIARTEQVKAGLERLLARLSRRLEREGQGARRLRLTVRRADGGEDAEEIGLMRPSRDVSAMAALFERGIARLDAGFGIDMLRLEALEVEPLAPAQTRIGGPDAGGALEALLSSLGNRLGFDALEHVAPASSHLPERSWRRIPAAAEPETGAPWPRPPAPRPITLIDPEPLRFEQDEAGTGEGRRPPQRFLWRGTAFSTARVRGPERIAPEWWRDDPAWRTGPRDYWRVETACGRGFWVFHTPSMPVAAPGSDRWFLHGLFA